MAKDQLGAIWHLHRAGADLRLWWAIYIGNESPPPTATSLVRGM